VLKQLGEYLNESLRRIDIPARVGGDEFVIICPETTKESAGILAERLRKGIMAMRIHEEDQHQGITASVGVASFPDDGDSPEEILERADRALYEAKARGKNCVCCWGDFPTGHKAPRGSVHREGEEESPDEASPDESEVQTYSSS
jgi:diguanylate cyclase (GGDEF)-like protein